MSDVQNKIQVALTIADKVERQSGELVARSASLGEIQGSIRSVAAGSYSGDAAIMQTDNACIALQEAARQLQSSAEDLKVYAERLRSS